MAAHSRISPIAPGAHIVVRDAVWRVQRVDYTSSGTQAWNCLGVSEIVRDQESIFLEEYEPEVEVLDPKLTRLERDTSKQHRAGLLYIESLLRDVPPPVDAIYAGHRAAMDVMDFQLEPAWMALQRPRQRILIADAVGLGKTLEAGILLSELIRRGRARRILVATTKAMLTQFQKEMWARFSIPLVRLDSIGLEKIRAEIPTHHNPFYFYDRTIISIDTLKQNNWFRTHLEHAHWDVVVVDEAHNVATRGTGDSLRARVANVLARNCDSLILLSATPHDGRAESFASLMNMLDPTAISDPTDYTKDEIHGLFVRRFKHTVKNQLKKHIPDREVLKARAPASSQEEQALSALAGLKLPALDEGAASGALFRTGLEKALFSSPAACLEQLRAPLRRRLVADQIPPNTLKRLVDRDASSPGAALREAAELLQAAPVAHDLLTLASVADAVERVTPEAFSRYRKLLETLRSLKWTARKSEDRLLIFTERRETMEFLARQLKADLELSDGQLDVMHGSLPDVEQQALVEEFGKTKSKLRVLVATDVASEGLNLHYLCHRVIHFDVPWSLMVFQQRNGRIDRYGQTRSPLIVYLITESKNESVRGDLRVLELLIERDLKAQENIGDPAVFLNVFDAEEEERIIARAIEEKTPVEELERRMDANLIDPFALLLGTAGETAESAPPTRSCPSLFVSDFEFATTALARLQELEPIKVEVDAKSHLVELTPPDDLKRRLRKVPAESRRADGVLLFSADPERVQRSLEDARKSEKAWPDHQLLWANNPLFDWLGDRLRSAFGRHTAPVLVSPTFGSPGRTAIIGSGLIANRRGRPLVHRWYVASFDKDQSVGVEPFDVFLGRSRLGRDPLPTSRDVIDPEAFAELLKRAVDAVSKQILVDREEFKTSIEPLLAKERQRLARMEKSKLAVIARQFEGRDDSASREKRSQRERKVRTVIADHVKWAEESMTIGREPFIQIVAVLCGCAR